MLCCMLIDVSLALVICGAVILFRLSTKPFGNMIPLPNINLKLIKLVAVGPADPVGPVGPVLPDIPVGPVTWLTGPVGPVAPVWPVTPVGPMGPPLGPVGPVIVDMLAISQAMMLTGSPPSASLVNTTVVPSVAV